MVWHVISDTTTARTPSEHPGGTYHVTSSNRTKDNYTGSLRSRVHIWATYLEPLDRVCLGDLVLVPDLRALRLALRHAVTRAVKHNEEVHTIDTYKNMHRE